MSRVNIIPDIKGAGIFEWPGQTIEDAQREKEEKQKHFRPKIQTKSNQKGADIFEWPGQTMEDVCAVSTIFIQFK